MNKKKKLFFLDFRFYIAVLLFIVIVLVLFVSVDQKFIKTEYHFKKDINFSYSYNDDGHYYDLEIPSLRSTKIGEVEFTNENIFSQRVKRKLVFMKVVPFSNVSSEDKNFVTYCVLGRGFNYKYSNAVLDLSSKAKVINSFYITDCFYFDDGELLTFPPLHNVRVIKALKSHNDYVGKIYILSNDDLDNGNYYSVTYKFKNLLMNSQLDLNSLKQIGVVHIHLDSVYYLK